MIHGDAVKAALEAGTTRFSFAYLGTFHKTDSAAILLDRVGRF